MNTAGLKRYATELTVVIGDGNGKTREIVGWLAGKYGFLDFVGLLWYNDYIAIENYGECIKGRTRNEK